MIDFITHNIGNDVDEAVRRLVATEHFRGGSIISMPVTYPSGSTVVLEITGQNNRWFVSDRGGGFQECELFGSARYFRAEAERVAAHAGIRFDGRDMFVAEVPANTLHGALIVVANCSAEAARVTTLKAAVRDESDSRQELYERLSSIYKNKDVQKDAELIGTSNHKWRISVLVKDQRSRAFFEPVAHHYVSVVGTAAKFHDFVRVDNPPERIAVIKSRADLADFYGVISGASSKVIESTASNEEFSHLLEAA